ncbi:Uncharacterised protein [Bordetella holmesii]|nr:Uncharacterised protein [Bordetella holmesii]
MAARNRTQSHRPQKTIFHTHQACRAAAGQQSQLRRGVRPHIISRSCGPGFRATASPTLRTKRTRDASRPSKGRTFDAFKRRKPTAMLRPPLASGLLALPHQPLDHVEDRASLMRVRVEIARIVEVSCGKQLFHAARTSRSSARRLSSVSPHPEYQGVPKQVTGLPAINASKPMCEDNVHTVDHRHQAKRLRSSCSMLTSASIVPR